jgi:hypothetical protein
VVLKRFRPNLPSPVAGPSVVLRRVVSHHRHHRPFRLKPSLRERQPRPYSHLRPHFAGVLNHSITPAQQAPSCMVRTDWLHRSRGLSTGSCSFQVSFDATDGG